MNFLAQPLDDLKLYSGEEAIAGTDTAISVTIFRLGKERFALPLKILQEVTQLNVIQPLPHRSNQLFLGLVSNRGEILLCVSLANILHVQQANTTPEMLTQKMIIMGQAMDKWAFPVDEVCGIFRFYLHELQAAPVVITKSVTGYSKGIVYWEGHKVNFLDWELLLYHLNQKIL